MNNKLESRLADIEKSRPINNDSELYEVILGIIEEERAKRPEERDFDLLDEAIDASLALAGKEEDSVLSDSETVMERALAAVPEDREPRYAPARVKWLIPVAAILAILLAAAVGAKVFDLPFFGREERDAVREEILDLTDGTVFEKDGWEVYVGEEMEKVNSLVELDAALSRDGLLLPYRYEDGVTDISTADYGESYRITIQTDVGLVDVKTDTGWGNTSPAFVRIGRFDVVYSHYDNVYQGEFVYNDCMYCITSETEEGLEMLIGSMEEIVK